MEPQAIHAFWLLGCITKRLLVAYHAVTRAEHRQHGSADCKQQRRTIKQRHQHTNSNIVGIHHRNTTNIGCSTDQHGHRRCYSHIKQH